MRPLPFILILLFSISSAAAISFEDNSNKVFYFYGQGCSHCANVADSGILEKISASGKVIEKYEVYHNQENAKKFQEMLSLLNIDKMNAGVPFAIIRCNGNYTYLSGDTPIINHLEEAVSTCKNFNNTNNLAIGVVIFAALADGIINPCALGVLAFLLILLSTIGSRKRMIKIVFIYILTIYLVYFTSGLGLFAAIQSSKLSSIIYKIAATALIIAGLVNLKDFLFQKKASLAIPQSQKPLLERYAHKATIPAALVLGVLVSLFELPCSGFFYISILGMLADSMTRLQAIPLLALYNLLFVLPLIVISLIVIKGFPPEKVQSWTNEKKNLFRLIMGGIMVALGALMLLGVF